MSAFEVVERLADTTLLAANLRYCVVDDRKTPLKIDGTPARVNVVDDFVDFESLLTCNLEDYAGVGISIQASEVCAIDVDKCFAVPNDISTADERAKFVIDLFKDDAYIEFSFSGRGLRVLFRQDIITDYSKTWYIKNQMVDIEYYQPAKSCRYVTVTGNTIANNLVDASYSFMDKIETFLNKYMRRPEHRRSNATTQQVEETRSLDELMKLVRVHYLKNGRFQDIWFTNAPGSGKDESERDYYLLAFLFENVTQDKEMLRKVFEQSPFFKTKDRHHIYKWEYNEHRYYNYIYDNLRSRH